VCVDREKKTEIHGVWVDREKNRIFLIVQSMAREDLENYIATYRRASVAEYSGESVNAPANIISGMGWDGMGWDGMGWDGMGWEMFFYQS